MTEDQWIDLATRSLAALIKERGAVVWTEAEAVLAESSWVRQNVSPSLPPNWAPQPHHLRQARFRLLSSRQIELQSATLNQRVVDAYIDGSGRHGRTFLDRTAASKRRLLRRYLTWAVPAGALAERIIGASLDALRGLNLWLPGTHAIGRVTQFRGQNLAGALDAAGAWALDPADHREGFLDFAVEVKNIRSWIYPQDDELWNLLQKLAPFEDVVPVLVARRIHPMTFKFVGDIGALAYRAGRQWFPSSIDATNFREVMGTLGFGDTVRVQEPATDPGVLHFFRSTVYHASSVDNRPIMVRAADRWNRSRDMVGQHAEAILEAKDKRQALGAFRNASKETGLWETGGW